MTAPNHTTSQREARNEARSRAAASGRLIGGSAAARRSRHGPSQACSTVCASAASTASRLEMAAANTPATTKPRRPSGKVVATNTGRMRSRFSVTSASASPCSGCASYHAASAMPTQATSSPTSTATVLVATANRASRTPRQQRMRCAISWSTP